MEIVKTSDVCRPKLLEAKTIILGTISMICEYTHVDLHNDRIEEYVGLPCNVKS